MFADRETVSETLLVAYYQVRIWKSNHFSKTYKIFYINDIQERSTNRFLENTPELESHCIAPKKIKENQHVQNSFSGTNSSAFTL